MLRRHNKIDLIPIFFFSPSRDSHVLRKCSTTQLQFPSSAEGSNFSVERPQPTFFCLVHLLSVTFVSLLSLEQSWHNLVIHRDRLLCPYHRPSRSILWEPVPSTPASLYEVTCSFSGNGTLYAFECFSTLFRNLEKPNPVLQGTDIPIHTDFKF